MYVVLYTLISVLIICFIYQYYAGNYKPQAKLILCHFGKKKERIASLLLDYYTFFSASPLFALLLFYLLYH